MAKRGRQWSGDAMLLSCDIESPKLHYCSDGSKGPTGIHACPGSLSIGWEVHQRGASGYLELGDYLKQNGRATTARLCVQWHPRPNLLPDCVSCRTSRPKSFLSCLVVSCSSSSSSPPRLSELAALGQALGGGVAHIQPGRSDPTKRRR